jgi:antitoxin VapB
MALSIKTAEADRLARELSQLTGETMTEAVTRSLAERLERLRRAREADRNLPARLQAFARHIASDYDTRPVTQAEWDAASGDEQTSSGDKR